MRKMKTACIGIGLISLATTAIMLLDKSLRKLDFNVPDGEDVTAVRVYCMACSNTDERAKRHGLDGTNTSKTSIPLFIFGEPPKKAERDAFFTWIEGVLDQVRGGGKAELDAFSYGKETIVAVTANTPRIITQECGDIFELSLANNRLRVTVRDKNASSFAEIVVPKSGRNVVTIVIGSERYAISTSNYDA